MDWLKSSLQAAQKQAQEAAEKARVIAQQASQQAKVLAEQASEQAKVFAEKASEQAKQASERAKVLASAAAEEAQAKLQQLASATTQVSSSPAGGADADPAELVKYGVTPGLLETVSGMTYSTFSDYPVEELPSTNPLGLTPPIPGPNFRLNPWQERHALLVLTRGDQLQGLRFALCPKRMSEELFWVIYFTLVKALLPPEAFKQTASTVEGAAASGSGASGTSAAGTSGESRTSLCASTSAMPASASAGSFKRSSSSTPPLQPAAAVATPAVSKAAADATAGAAAAPGSTPAVSRSSDEAVLVDLGSSCNAGDEDDEDDDGEADGGDLDALEDDPELAAYLQEALDVAEGGEADGLSDLGSASDDDDDLDDYINQLDAELGAEAGGSGDRDGREVTSPSPARPVKPVDGAD